MQPGGRAVCGMKCIVLLGACGHVWKNPLGKAPYLISSTVEPVGTIRAITELAIGESGTCFSFKHSIGGMGRRDIMTINREG